MNTARYVFVLYIKQYSVNVFFNNEIKYNNASQK